MGRLLAVTGPARKPLSPLRWGSAPAHSFRRALSSVRWRVASAFEFAEDQTSVPIGSHVAASRWSCSHSAKWQTTCSRRKICRLCNDTRQARRRERTAEKNPAIARIISLEPRGSLRMRASSELVIPQPCPALASVEARNHECRSALSVRC